eukprot:jgi/Mesvir1/16013/Mv26465-RA.1
METIGKHGVWANMHANTYSNLCATNTCHNHCRSLPDMIGDDYARAASTGFTTLSCMMEHVYLGFHPSISGGTATVPKHYIQTLTCLVSPRDPQDNAKNSW